MTETDLTSSTNIAISEPLTGGDSVPVDVFTAARWFDELCNSSAKAVAVDRVEWQCSTWGSGRGNGDWLDTANFSVVAELFDLDTGRNYDARDELLVWIPLSMVPETVRVIDRLGDEPEGWPWLREEDLVSQVAQAAEVLGVSVSAVADDEWLLEALRIQ